MQARSTSTAGRWEAQLTVQHGPFDKGSSPFSKLPVHLALATLPFNPDSLFRYGDLSRLSYHCPLPYSRTDNGHLRPQDRFPRTKKSSSPDVSTISYVGKCWTLEKCMDSGKMYCLPRTRRPASGLEGEANNNLDAWDMTSKPQWSTDHLASSPSTVRGHAHTCSIKCSRSILNWVLFHHAYVMASTHRSERR